MTDYFVDSNTCGIWTAGFDYSLGARVVCTTGYGTTARRAHVYECTTDGGSSGGSEPAWPASGTVVDGGITWTQRVPSTRANASRFVGYLLNHLAVAGETLWTRDTHVEAYPGTFVYGIAAAVNNPVRCISIGWTTDSPGESDYSLGAVISPNADGQQPAFAGNTYWWGFTIRGASGSGGNSYMNFAPGNAAACFFDRCAFQLVSTGTTNNHFWMGSIGASLGMVVWRDCSAKFAATGQGIKGRNVSFVWYSTDTNFYSKIDSAGSAPTTLISIDVVPLDGNWEFVGVDLSHLAGTLCGTNSHDLTLRGCRIHASLTLQAAGTPSYDQSPTRRPNVAMYNCDSTTGNLRFEERYRGGSVKQDLTTYLTAGAEHDGVNYSYLLTPNSNIGSLAAALPTPPIIAYLGSTGSKTFTVECLPDRASDLTDKEIFIEVAPLASASYPYTPMFHDAPDKFYHNAGTAQPAGVGTGSWTVDAGITNERSQKVEKTITVNQTGFYFVRVVLTANVNTRVNPGVTVT